MVICDADGAEISNGYGGSMEVRCLGDGYTLVNSLPLERYLQDVVPSEMPASYERSLESTGGLRAQLCLYPAASGRSGGIRRTY